MPPSAHAMEVVTPDECAVAIEMDPNLVSGVALGTPALIREGESAGTSMVSSDHYRLRRLSSPPSDPHQTVVAASELAIETHVGA